MTHSASYHDKAYICVHVFDSSRPVLLASRSGGDWSFLCGAEHEDTAENYRVVGRGHILDRDATLGGLADLAPDWEAERTSIGTAWVQVIDAGFEVEGLYGVEGPGWILPDLVARWNDPERREIILRVARALESEPSVLGCSAHLIVVGRKLRA